MKGFVGKKKDWGMSPILGAYLEIKEPNSLASNLFV
jgi:hypothetical protein